jgi:transcriptional regulator with XRE-family HTH domain
MEPLDPLVRRRLVGHQLRRLRESAGMSQSDVLSAMDWSKSKINRVENGVVAVATSDLLLLLQHYGVGDPEVIRRLTETARESRRHSQWSDFRGVVSPEYYSFVAHEEAARSIRSFQPLVVPGLLQTDDYAAAVTGSYGRRTADYVRKRVELRARRQSILERPEGRPDCCFLLSEAVIRIRVGDARVMRAQLRRLIEIAEEPNLRLRIVPFTHGIHPHWREPYVLLEVGDPADGDLALYLETPRGELLRSESNFAADEEDTSDRQGGDAGPGRRPGLRPSEWLDDHVTLEAEVGGPETTLERLQEALARATD